MIHPMEFLSIITGGQLDTFFQKHWRKRTLLASRCLPQLDHYYTGAKFLEDYRHVGFHGATCFISIGQDNQRSFSVPQTWEMVESALNRGTPMALLALGIPQRPSPLPLQWREFISFHEGLRSFLCADYPAPSRGIANYLAVESVDFFYNSPQCRKVTTGGHYDTGDVFYFVLEGRKVWTVDLTPDLDTVKSLIMLPGGLTNLTNVDRSTQRECVDMTLNPGDCLYVPPYTYHRVTSEGSSLAVSIGLPTFNEATFLGYALFRLQHRRKIFQPLPCFPSMYADLCVSAKQETRKRLQQILEMLAQECEVWGTQSQNVETRQPNERMTKT